MTLIALAAAFAAGMILGRSAETPNWRSAARLWRKQARTWETVVEEALERAVKAEQRERATKERALIVLAAADVANATAKEAIAQRDAARATLRLERDMRGQQ